MTVREQLRAEDPFLHEALERSWRIAHENWLPAIGTSHGSHNAYPHLHNMELRLNDLAEAFGGGERRPAFRLSPAETYLLLAAILFHDIGRGSKKHPDPDHALGSYDILIGDGAERWATYGIPDHTLAHIIAKLSLHHAPTKGSEKQHPLSERTVDPFGRVRENGLLAVLVLLDQLDASYRRVIPPEMGTGVKGFRTRVQGVQLDQEARLVRSVIAGFEGDDEEAQQPRPLKTPRKLEYFASGSSYAEWRADEALRYAEDSGQPFPQGAAEYIRAVGKARECSCPDDTDSALRHLNEEQRAAIREVVAAIALTCAVAEGGGPFPEDRQLTECEKLAVLQRDLRSSAAKLQRFHTDLYSMGITLDDWLLELDEHLFTETGHETWEPIFDLSYLRRVASEMWKLSGQIFGRATFTYDTLAAAVREPDVARIRQAVKRLSILTDDLPLMKCESEESESRGALEAHDLWWRWRVEGESRRHCRCVRFEKVRQRLETLDEQRAKAKQHLDEVVAPKAGGPS